MYKRIFVGLVWFFCHFSSIAQINTIDNIVRGEMKRQHIAGLSLGIVRDGRIIMQRGYGFENLKDSIPASENTVYRLGSLSKQFIATAIMELAAQNKLSLSDHVGKYLKDAPESWDHITIRSLLNHTSGLERESPINTEATLIKRYPDSFVIQAAYYDTLLCATGSKWSYSNLGYFILADIIRKISGQRFADHMNDLFSLWGLTHTATTDKAVSYTKATGYKFNDKTEQNTEVADIATLRPASAFSSSIADMLKWDSIQREGKLLSSRDWARMYEDTVAMIAGNDDGGYYGYGWEVLSQNKHRLVQHGGNPYGGGFTADYWKFIDDKISIIVIANATIVDLNKICYKISVALEPALKRPVVKVANADKYVGVYRNDVTTMKITVYNEDGELSAQATGQSAFPLTNTGKDAFKYAAADIKMEFVPQEKKFIFEQQGHTYTFTKEAPHADKQNSKYAGVYGSDGLAMKMTISDEDGELSAQATGQSAFPLKNIGKDTFTFTTADIEMDFIPAEEKFILKQHGVTYIFKME